MYIICGATNMIKNFENKEKQQLDKLIKAVAKCGADYNDIP